MKKFDIDLENCTYGMEIEAGGMDKRTVLPEGCTWCTKDGSIINEKGIGNDPKGKYNLVGGEIQTRAVHSEKELAELAIEILEKTNCPTINIPSTMHIHIKIPDLLKSENVEILKSFILWNQENLPKISNMISKLPPMETFTKEKYPNELHFKQVVRAFKDKYRSRHSVFVPSIIEKVKNSNASTVDELINSLPPQNKKGQPIWSIFKRTGVNFKKLRTTDIGTIEFRMFSATDNPELIKNITEFPRKYIKCFLENKDVVEEFKDIEYPGWYGWLDENEEYSLNHLYTDHDKVSRPEIVSYLKSKLISRDILLSDLGYPKEFWAKELGSDVYEILEKYSFEGN